MKICFKCGIEKELNAFYKHPQMADGHVNKCKECNKRDVRENRKEKIGYYRKYDRARGNRQTKEYRDRDRAEKPIAYRARRIVGYHISKGNLVKEPCEVCGVTENIHAHHNDYAKALNVRWLCAAHHAQWHKENGEGLNG